ncbi:MAG: tRNA (adenosine(37)-N6)-threonylcarbamoyltransferase complex transferase subunit TsaD [Candidatus Kerfeldbacteria bacterium]|nr:tRNA (adenosine(37)-N6)-threonylcarbamoyltransferase complex transferase subunit TsaD [Candidatus Kerfeldbacteria bacterium]
MRVLGIETSCDDTSVGIVRYKSGRFAIESQVTASQVLIHRRYGGVVPEVAAREHALTILPTITAALARARRRWSAIDAIAVTAGPGLNTALLVGVETARTLGYLLKKPLVAVNHIEGHVVSSWASPAANAIHFPAVALIVSGGHTELIHITGFGRYRLIGRTLDDAVGEAFDKTAKILGLPYPGGPEIARRASRGNPQAFIFPRALMKAGSLDFSYSGLKTAVLYEAQKHHARSPRLVNDLCASFQQAALEPLIEKTRRAAVQKKARTIILGGGVAANANLRSGLEQMVAALPRVTYVQPALSLCMDNGVMIAMAGAIRAQRKDYTAWPRLQADPNWELVGQK